MLYNPLFIFVKTRCKKLFTFYIDDIYIDSLTNIKKITNVRSLFPNSVHDKDCEKT